MSNIRRSLRLKRFYPMSWADGVVVCLPLGMPHIPVMVALGKFAPTLKKHLNGSWIGIFFN